MNPVKFRLRIPWLNFCFGCSTIKSSTLLLIWFSWVGILLFELVHVLAHSIALQNTSCSCLFPWILKALFVHVCVYRMVSNNAISRQILEFCIGCFLCSNILCKPLLVPDLLLWLESVTCHVHLGLTWVLLVGRTGVNVCFCFSRLSKDSSCVGWMHFTVSLLIGWFLGCFAGK